jgi:adenine-specific DNA-methyltransferase
LMENKFISLFEDGRIWFGKDGKARPRLKKFISESEGSTIWTWWLNTEVGHNQEATKEIISLVGHNVFETPKPTRLLSRILQLATCKDSLILDSFAGSGTTAHATLKLNAQDGGNRRFILIEMEDYANTITAERVRRVMSGYEEGNKQVPGLGGGFDYYTIGEPIFNPDDTLNEAVGIVVIRNYVAYSEGIPNEDQTPQDNAYTPYLMGLNSDTAWVFYYEPNQVTCLDLDFLDSLKFGAAKPETAIIYADKCLLTKEFIAKYGVIFKKIPRDITRF